MLKMGGYKLTLKVSKIDVKNDIIIDAKMCLKLICHGGVQNVKNRQISISGTRDPHFINFLKLSHFLQKRSRFRPPKSTP
jgi:hypothetical protein